MLLSSQNPGMRLSNGNIIYLNRLGQAEYDIETVAEVLGKIQRFNCHATRKYSVAEHCWHASYLYAYNRKGALMHDAAEFLTGDLPTPVKQYCEGIKRLEAIIDADLERRFDFDPVDITFKVIDSLLFQIEHSALFDQVKVYDVDVKLYFWDEETAAKRFLERFEELDC